MTAQPGEPPTLGEVYWHASGARIPAYADLPGEARVRMERGAAAAGAAAIERLAQGEPDGDLRGQLEAAVQERDELRAGYRDLLCMNFHGSPEIGRYAQISLTMLNRHRARVGLDQLMEASWDTPEPAPELAAAMTENVRLREQAEQLRASLTALAAKWDAGAQAVLDQAFPGLRRELNEMRAERDRHRDELAALQHRLAALAGELAVEARINEPSKKTQILESVVGRIRGAIGAEVIATAGAEHLAAQLLEGGRG